MKVKVKDTLILYFSLFCGQLWSPGQKQGFSHNTKYPRMKSDQKTFLLKCSQNHPKCLKLQFFLKCTKMFHFSHCGGGGVLGVVRKYACFIAFLCFNFLKSSEGVLEVPSSSPLCPPPLCPSMFYWGPFYLLFHLSFILKFFQKKLVKAITMQFIF